MKYQIQIQESKFQMQTDSTSRNGLQQVTASEQGPRYLRKEIQVSGLEY
jgi:hypothetical protein